MRICKTGMFALLFCHVFALHGQETDSLQLREIQIRTDRFRIFRTGQPVVVMDTILKKYGGTYSLSELLQEGSAVYIKNYGQGNIAMPSLRGTNAEHTAVLWNGFNLQSAMMGVVDVSLISSNIADEIEIHFGGNGALFGSGAIGGAVHLHSRPRYESGLHGQAEYGFGSYGNTLIQSSMTYGNRIWYGKFFSASQIGENNFPYRNPSFPDAPMQKQTHARTNQLTWLTEHFFRIAPHQELVLRLWHQQSHREIPPVMSVPTSGAIQDDTSWRAAGEWNLRKNNQFFTLRSGLFNSILNYFDRPKITDSRSRTFSQITEAEYTFSLLSRFTLLNGLHHTYNSVSTTAYSKSNNRMAHFFSLKWKALHKPVGALLSIRNEWINGQWLPVMPLLAGEWRPFASWTFTSQISRSYRVPTFNELYWNPGGNPLLLPESGWGQELGVGYKRKHQSLFADIGISVFNRQMINWIAWLPDSGTVWTPQNIYKVWNRGFEGRIHLRIKINPSFVLSLNSGIQTIRATTEYNTGSYQLPYVPRVTQQYRLGLDHPRGYIRLGYTYTGMRFIANDNSRALDDFQLADIKAGFHFQILRCRIQPGLAINNLFNSSYVIMPDRAMPLRNYLIQINIQF